MRTPPPRPCVIGPSTTTGCASPPHSRDHGHGHGHDDVHRLPPPSRGRTCTLIGRPGRREPRHLRLRDGSVGSLIAAALLADPFICSPTRCCCAATASGHGPRRDHRWPHRPGHGDGRAARHGRRRHHGRAGVHGGRRVAVALRRAGNLERRLRGRWRTHAFISPAGPPRTHFLPWSSFF